MEAHSLSIPQVRGGDTKRGHIACSSIILVNCMTEEFEAFIEHMMSASMVHSQNSFFPRLGLRNIK